MIHSTANNIEISAPNNNNNMLSLNTACYDNIVHPIKYFYDQFVFGNLVGYHYLDNCYFRYNRYFKTYCVGVFIILFSISLVFYTLSSIVTICYPHGDRKNSVTVTINLCMILFFITNK